MSFGDDSSTTVPTTISLLSSSVASGSIITKSPQQLHHYKFYLNVTQEVPINYAIVLYGHITPILFTITITVNTLIVIVLLKRHMRTPTNSLLMSMALCDMCTILFPFPWFIYMYTLGNHFRPLASQTLCYAWTWMNEVIPATFHTASIWLTLSLAVQRYVYVCHPIAAKSFCTQANVSRTIIWILVIAVLHQSTHFFDKNFIEETILWNNKTQTVCYVENAAWVHTLTVNVYYTLYYSFRVVFVHLIPCASLVILNCLLFNAMRKASKNHKNLLLGNKTTCSTSNGANCKSSNINNNNNNHCLDNMNASCDGAEPSTAATSACGFTNSTTGCRTSKKVNSTRKIRDTNRTTQMLIVVVIVFLLVEIPLAIVTILHIISSTICEILNYEFANKLILLTNFFIIASYPINFAIYCGMSKQFRETFIAIFVPQRLRHRQQQRQRRRRQQQQEREQQQEFQQQQPQQLEQRPQTNAKRSKRNQKKSLLPFRNQFGSHLDPSTAAFTNETSTSAAEHSEYSYGAVTATTASTVTTV